MTHRSCINRATFHCSALALILLLVALASCRGSHGIGATHPVAALTAAESSGPAPLTVQFDASGSFDPNGSITSYDWDFDGDGHVDDTTVSPTISHVYNVAGTFTATVTVHDNSGETDSASLSVHVLTGTWQLLTLDSIGNVGAYTSAALINGTPAIAYSDETNLRQKYIIAANAAGTTWGIPVTVNNTDQGGPFASLAQISGRPAISFVNQALNRVEYVRALDSFGNTWGDPVPVGLPSTVVSTSLLEIEGNPAVAFVDEGAASNGEAVYIRAFDANGQSWSNGVLVDDVDEDVGTLDLAMVHGVPAVLYSEELSHTLRFVQARDSVGQSWFLPVTAQSAGSVGNFVSLAIADSKPAASYMDVSGANADLFYAQALDPDGVNWNTRRAVDADADSSGQYNSLAVIGGAPAIAYYDLTAGALMFVRALDASGNNWGAPQVVDDGSATGPYCSLVDVNGAPGISYYDQADGDLLWAVLQ